MSKSQAQNQVKPKIIKGKIKLFNQEIKVGINAVDNNGRQAPIEEIIKNLKRAEKEQLFPPMFPPIVTPQNG